MSFAQKCELQSSSKFSYKIADFLLPNLLTIWFQLHDIVKWGFKLFLHWDAFIIQDDWKQCNYIRILTVAVQYNLIGFLHNIAVTIEEPVQVTLVLLVLFLSSYNQNSRMYFLFTWTSKLSVVNDWHLVISWLAWMSLGIHFCILCQTLTISCLVKHLWHSNPLSVCIKHEEKGACSTECGGHFQHFLKLFLFCVISVNLSSDKCVCWEWNGLCVINLWLYLTSFYYYVVWHNCLWAVTIG